MKKYARSYRRKRIYRRRRRTTKKSSKYARRQQKAASNWVRKKYVKTYVIETPTIGDFEAGYTISLIGGKNAADPAYTISLPNNN